MADEPFRSGLPVIPEGETPAPAPDGTQAPFQSGLPVVADPQQSGGWNIGANLMSLVPGMSSGGWGPQNWKPPAYGASDAAVHGATLGASDLARGAIGDLYGGPSMADVKASRDQYATEHPVANFASNLAGGVGTAPLLPGAGAFRTATALAKPFGRLAEYGATVGTGALLGGGYGAAGGAIDEAPTGDLGQIGEGARRGAEWGAAFGAGLPAVVGAGTGLWRAGRDWLGPLTTSGNEAAVGRQILTGATDPIAARTAGELQGPADPNTAPPPQPPLRPSGFPVPGATDPNAPISVAEARAAPSDAGAIIPGSRPTTAQVTGDAGLTQLERQSLTDTLAKPEANRTPAEADLVARAGQQSTARTDFFRTAIDPAADPQAFKTELQSHINAMDAQHEANVNVVTAQHEANLTAAQQQLERAQTDLGQPLPPEVRGGQMRDQLEAAKAVTKANERDLWSAVDPNGTLRVDARNTAADARDIVRDISPNAKAPEGEEAAIFQRAIMGGSAVPFGDVTALRSRLLTAMREERLANGESPALRRMAMLRESIDGTINDLAASGADAGTVARLRAASQATRDRAETFKNQFVGPLLETRGAAGDFKVPDTNVGQKIIANNQSAQAHLAAGGDQATLKGALVDDLNRSLKGGELTPQKLQTWRANREGAIRAVPGLDAELGNVAGAQNLVGQLAQTRDVAVTQATQARADAMRQAQAGAVGKVLGGDPQPQISALLTTRPLGNTGRNATSEMMRLRQAVAGDPTAEAGLQRAVVNHINSEFIDQNGNFKTAQFLKFMREKGGTVEAGVGTEAMQILRTVERDLQRQGVGQPLSGPANRAGRVSGTSPVWQALMQNLHKPLVQGAAGTMGVLGVGGAAGVIPAVPAAVGVIGTMVARTLRANGIASRADLLAEAMGNPALARALALRATPANTPIIGKAITAAMAGSRAAGGLTSDTNYGGQR